MRIEIENCLSVWELFSVFRNKYNNFVVYRDGIVLGCMNNHCITLDDTYYDCLIDYVYIYQNHIDIEILVPECEV